MPLEKNIPPDEKAFYYDFFSDVIGGIGFEPVLLKKPAAMLLLPKGSTGMQQVHDLREIARKYNSYADNLEAEIQRSTIVVPESANGDAEDDLPPMPASMQRPAPVAPRTRGRGR